MSESTTDLAVAFLAGAIGGVIPSLFVALHIISERIGSGTEAGTLAIVAASAFGIVIVSGWLTTILFSGIAGGRRQ